MMHAMRVIFTQECKLLYRQATAWVTPLCFFAIILFLFPLAFPTLSIEAKHGLPGCVWIASVFANSYSLQTLFLSDLENLSIEQWALAPTPFSLLVSAKVAAIGLATQVPLLILTGLLCLIFKLSPELSAVLLISLCLGSPIIILLCSLSLALTLGLKHQGALLGLILIPLMIPLFILGINACELAALDLNAMHAIAAIAGLCLLSVIALPPAIAFALRVGMDH